MIWVYDNRTGGSRRRILGGKEGPDISDYRGALSEETLSICRFEFLFESIAT